MRPDDGDILAMATLPGFGPGEGGRATEGHPERRLNEGVWWCYEPGSTFKPFVVAAALEEGKVTLGDTFLCTGHRMVGKRKIRCWTEAQRRSPHGRLNLENVLAQSCNVGMMDVVERLGQSKFEEYFHKFGFDEKLLNNCGSERNGGVREPPVPLGDFLGFGFGQGLMVTPLELATAYCTLANGGQMVRPRLVRKIVNCDTLEQKVVEPEVVRRVVSEATAQKVLEAMVLTVEQGTGKAGKIEGVKVAGKTGTAEKAERGKGFGSGKRVVSFAAILPADAPKFVVLVVVDEPKGSASGGTAAAPAAKRIIEAMLALERADFAGKNLIASRKAPGETG
jgi:cell division protein FtsI/penicillin-binding protein 2